MKSITSLCKYQQYVHTHLQHRNIHTLKAYTVCLHFRLPPYLRWHTNIYHAHTHTTQQQLKAHTVLFQTETLLLYQDSKYVLCSCFSGVDKSYLRFNCSVCTHIIYPGVSFQHAHMDDVQDIKWLPCFRKWMCQSKTAFLEVVVEQSHPKILHVACALNLSPFYFVVKLGKVQ